MLKPPNIIPKIKISAKIVEEINKIFEISAAKK
jgi:hypothetical protein